MKHGFMGHDHKTKQDVSAVTLLRIYLLCMFLWILQSISVEILINVHSNIPDALLITIQTRKCVM